MPHQQLIGFPVVLEIDVAWGEMDSFDHVNNVVYFRYFENARIAYMTRIGWFDLMRDAGLGPIVKSADAVFRKPVKYPDRLSVGARIVKVESDRVTFEQRVVSAAWGDVAAEGEAVVVSYDYRANRKAPLPEQLVAAIQALERPR
jgi:acyl-CoA thioester hydrolase